MNGSSTPPPTLVSHICEGISRAVELSGEGHPECGQHNPTGWSPEEEGEGETDRQTGRKRKLAAAFISLHFLTGVAM